MVLFDVARERKWLGKKSGRGFYIYDETKRRRHRSAAPRGNVDLLGVLGQHSHWVALDADSIQRRLVTPMVNEAQRALQEGVTDSAETIDLASVLGLGLAPFRGGIMQFAKQSQPPVAAPSAAEVRNPEGKAVVHAHV